MLSSPAKIILDTRRYIRPFFLSPAGQPLPSKQYYDIASWVLTQLFFSFTVVPFIILRVGPSFTVWSRVSYFGIIGVALSTAFFASPAKGWLSAKVKARTATERPGISRTKSDGDGVMLGMPMDVEKEYKELEGVVKIVRDEIERRRKAGLPVDVRDIIRGKLGIAPDELESMVKKEL
jgi:lysophospholipid acyltransferase